MDACFITLCVAIFTTTHSWKLTLFEDFNGDTLNTSIWNIRTNESHCCPQEDEIYEPQNVQLKDGLLHLITKRQNITYAGVSYNFTSGWIDTKEKWYQTYGKWEVNASLPQRNSTGIWPAHWLMPNPSTAIPPNVCWPVGGEIDIMEYTASDLPDGNKIAGTYRWGTECDRDKQATPGGLYPPGMDPTWNENDFHIYGVEWNQTHMSFSVDGNKYETVTQEQANLPKDNPFYIILNTAIAFYWPPHKDSNYPAYHIIDWVKVYQYD
eukprot:7793_1